MRQGKNRRLANVKTRRETGLDHVMFNLDLNTPFGRKQLKEIQPYYPGEEVDIFWMAACWRYHLYSWWCDLCTKDSLVRKSLEEFWSA